MATQLWNSGGDDIRSHLEEFGWVVVPGVVSTQECDGYKTDIRKWLDQFGEGFPKNIGSIVHQYNIAHLEAAWKARMKTKPVFESIWGTSKLHTSTDGISIGQPPEHGATDFDHIAPGANTLHLDQGAKKIGLHAYQGALYLEEVQEDDWTFMVIEKSHKYHKDFFTNHRHTKSEFRKLAKREIKWYEDHGCQVKRLTIPKGGMVLWDSRTVHAGAPPKQGRKNPGRWRYVVFVSMTPAIWAGIEDVKEKQKGYKNLGISRHWSSSGFSLFKSSPKNPCNITDLPDIAKTETAKLLCGVSQYDFADDASNGPKWKPILKP